jgi:uncharacterized Fe-S cluster-containing protein
MHFLKTLLAALSILTLATESSPVCGDISALLSGLDVGNDDDNFLYGEKLNMFEAVSKQMPLSEIYKLRLVCKPLHKVGPRIFDFDEANKPSDEVLKGLFQPIVKEGRLPNLGSDSEEDEWLMDALSKYVNSSDGDTMQFLANHIETIDNAIINHFDYAAGVGDVESDGDETPPEKQLEEKANLQSYSFRFLHELAERRDRDKDKIKINQLFVNVGRGWENFAENLADLEMFEVNELTFHSYYSMSTMTEFVRFTEKLTEKLPKSLQLQKKLNLLLQLETGSEEDLDKLADWLFSLKNLDTLKYQNWGATEKHYKRVMDAFKDGKTFPNLKRNIGLDIQGPGNRQLGTEADMSELKKLFEHDEEEE